MPADTAEWAEQPASPEQILPRPNPNRAVAVAEEQEHRGCSFDLVVSLAAKGFVILTGPSGTGKSKAALDLSVALQNLTMGAEESPSYALVPVGADWTDTRNLLGYRNPFGAPRKTEAGEVTHESYHVTDTLRLLLKAADPDRAEVPHILILDEMNLSHVERYFSPFLSLMEAGRIEGVGRPELLSPEIITVIAEVLQAEAPNAAETEAAIRLSNEGTGLPISPNLYVVGTVNVDETTYMFSPKVLDRAHVIEMEAVRPSAFIQKEETAAAMQVDPQVALETFINSRQFREEGFYDQTHPSIFIAEAAGRFGIPAATADEIVNAATTLLDGAYKLLRPVGFPFGFRTIVEIFGYVFTWMQVMDQVAEDDSYHSRWPEALDQAFLQKVLPKIHGNRRQLGTSLLALHAFLLGKDKTGTPPARYQSGDAEEWSIEPGETLVLPTGEPMVKSRRKLADMHQQLSATGYVSFVR